MFYEHFPQEKIRNFAFWASMANFILSHFVKFFKGFQHYHKKTPRNIFGLIILHKVFYEK